MTESVKISVLVPTRDTIPSWFAYSLGLAMGYMGKNHPDVDVTLYFNNGTVLSEQRTALAKLAMLDKADWTIWFDSDMRFPSDTIERLVAHKQPIVGAGYPTRKMPAIEPTVYADREGKIRVYTEKDSTGLEPVVAMGFGCICVHKEVFEAMPPPWFHIPWDEEKMKFDCGEDVYFCRKAGDHGFQIMLDHDLSKDVYHIGNTEFGYGEALAARPYINDLRKHLVSRAMTK